MMNTDHVAFATTLDDWLASIADRTALFDPEAGVAGNYASMFALADAITANANTVDRDHGSVDPFRARVDTLKRDTDRDPSLVDFMGRPVDPVEGSRHYVRRGMSRRRRPTAVVKAFGAASVQGSTASPYTDDAATRAAMLAGMASHLLTYARPLRLGRVGFDVTRITDAVYGHDLDQVTVGVDHAGNDRTATLLGTEVRAYSEMFDPMADGMEALALFDLDTFGRPAPLPRSGRSVSFRVLAVSTTPGEQVTYLAHANHSPCVDTLKRPTARRSLRLTRPRKAELPLLVTSVSPYPLHQWNDRRTAIDRRPVPNVITSDSAPRSSVSTSISYGTASGWCDLAIVANGMVMLPCTPLIGASDRPGRVFIGHRLIVRPHARRGNNDARTARRASVRASLYPVLSIDTEAGWCELLDALEPGHTDRWKVNGHRVNATRSAHAGKFNVRVDGHAPIQLRSAATMARRLALLTMTT